MKNQFLRALKSAAIVSKGAPKGSRNTRVEIAEGLIRISATDGVVWYEQVLRDLDGGKPRTFAADSEELVRAARRADDLNKLLPVAQDRLLVGSDPRHRAAPLTTLEWPRDLCATVLFSAAEQDKPHKNGVEISWASGSIHALATDGNRATHAWKSASYQGYPQLVVVPKRAVECALAIFEADAQFSVWRDYVQIGTPDVPSGSEVLAARTPIKSLPVFDDYRPRAFVGESGPVSRTVVESLVRAVGAFSGAGVDLGVESRRVGHGNNPIGCLAVHGSLPKDVRDSLPKGEYEDATVCRILAAEAKGDGVVHLDSDLLAQALGVPVSDQVEILVGEKPTDPVVIRAIGFGWEHLLMPRRRE